MSEHTQATDPAPWRLTNEPTMLVTLTDARSNSCISDHVSLGRIIASADGELVVVALGKGPDAQARAERIIRAVNNYGDLLAELQAVRTLIGESEGVTGYHLNGDIATWDEFGWPDDIDAVLARAEGRQ